MDTLKTIAYEKEDLNCPGFGHARMPCRALVKKSMSDHTLPRYIEVLEWTTVPEFKFNSEENDKVTHRGGELWAESCVARLTLHNSHLSFPWTRHQITTCPPPSQPPCSGECRPSARYYLITFDSSIARPLGPGPAWRPVSGPDLTRGCCLRAEPLAPWMLTAGAIRQNGLTKSDRCTRTHAGTFAMKKKQVVYAQMHMPIRKHMGVPALVWFGVFYWHFLIGPRGSLYMLHGHLKGSPQVLRS